MQCGLMVNPKLVGNGDHVNFICGNDESAKTKVRDLLNQFGWPDKHIIDLGEITGARATESLLPIWLSIMGIKKSGVFNFKIVGI